MSNIIPFDESPDYLTVASVYIALVLPIAPASEIDGEPIVWADTLGWKTEPPSSSSGPSYRTSQDDGTARDTTNGSAAPDPTTTTTLESFTSAPVGGVATTGRSAAAPTSHSSSSIIVKPAWGALAPSGIHCDLSTLRGEQGHGPDSWPSALEEFMRQPWHLEKLSRQHTIGRSHSFPLAAALPTATLLDTSAPSLNSGSGEEGSPLRSRVWPVNLGGMGLGSELPASPPVSPVSAASCSRDRDASVQVRSGPTSLSSSVFIPSEVMFSGRDFCVRGRLEQQEVVIKFATSTERMAELENETRVYERLASISASGARVSEMFAGSWGLYAPVPSLDVNGDDNGHNRGPACALALVLEYVGEGLDGRYAGMGGMTSLDK